MLVLTLMMLLIGSVIINFLQGYKWRSYRKRPAGTHSHTGMLPIQRKDR